MENNYFKIDDLDIEYPIHISYHGNGRRWNFKSEYEKVIKARVPDISHIVIDALVDTDFFSPSKVYKNIPFLVTDDIRVKGDKRSYYLVDYFIPSINTIILLITNLDMKMKSPKFKYLSEMLGKMGYNVFILDPSNFNPSEPSAVKYLKSLRNTFSFITVDKVIYPKYFK